MSPEGAVDHRISAQDEHIHYTFDNSIEPIETVESGERVLFECRDVTDGYLDAESTVTDMMEKPSKGHPLTGPVTVEGATPGDVLEISIIDVTHRGIGFTYFHPREVELGLIPDEFDEPGLYVWELDGETGHFVNGIDVPLDPFPGIVSVMPEVDGEHSTVPPRSVGGNMDIKHLTAGSTLYLPVAVDGGNLSIGDCHAAQGDGEVCVTGIEAPMKVTVDVAVRSDMDIEQPQFRTRGPFTPSGTDEPMFCTTGIAPDLRKASQRAIRQMITHLTEHRDLTPEEAYILCSAIVDLKINEVVNVPNVVVSAYLPEGIFPDRP